MSRNEVIAAKSRLTSVFRVCDAAGISTMLVRRLRARTAGA
jgi:hypothetical protein